MTNANIKRLTLIATLFGTIAWAVSMFRQATQ